MRAIDGEVFAAFDVQRMSRAFVRESDEAAESLPERVVSSHPNFVTTTGLRQIEEQVANLETARQTARGAADKALLARIERDLRYWTQRLATARVIEFAPASANAASPVFHSRSRAPGPTAWPRPGASCSGGCGAGSR